MSDGSPQLGTIETRIPVRLDRRVLFGVRAEQELARRVGARYWGPGRFRAAPREAVAGKRVKRLRRDQYAPISEPTDSRTAR